MEEPTTAERISAGPDDAPVRRLRRSRPRRPAPRQQLVDAADRVPGADLGEHAGEVALGIEPIGPDGLEERVDRRALAARVRARGGGGAKLLGADALISVFAAGLGSTSPRGGARKGTSRMLRSRVDPAEPLGPAWREEVGRDLTALGGVAVLTPLSVAALTAPRRF